MDLVKRRQSQRLWSRCKIALPLPLKTQIIFMLNAQHSISGSNITAGAIRATMLYTMTSPRVYTTLQAKIDSATINNKISSPVVRDAEARALPYLQAVIKEGLRILPPVAGLASKLVPPQGETINGVFVPGGTKIGGNHWALLRSTEAFGSDATAFRPERWLEGSPEQCAKIKKVYDLIWGHGKYIFLGRSVALIELNKIFVEVSHQRVEFFWYSSRYQGHSC